MDFKLSSIFGNPFKKNLAANTNTAQRKRTLNYTPKSVYRTRIDIKNWIDAQAMAQNAELTQTYPLQLLFTEIAVDALLTGQINNRHEQVFSSAIQLVKPGGEIDESQTELLSNLSAYRDLTNAILESRLYGYNLVELELVKNEAGQYIPKVTELPRTNIVPQLGVFYPDYSDPIKSIKYRELPEFGTWILEFNTGTLGLLNKVVSHTLFKRFAQSCWSELCEIFGIPPRVIKTNTQDAGMLNRAEKMMRDTGAAPWFIIDDTEEFEWGTSVATKGEVFSNLIQLCNNEISLAISGAIIGQDTRYGNRSKDESGQEMLWLLVQSDMKLVSEAWNTIIIPAFKKLGILKGDLRFQFAPSEDLEQLWKFTEGLLNAGKNVKDEWLKEKFGVEVTGDKPQPGAPVPEGGKKDKGLKLNGFFA